MSRVCLIPFIKETTEMTPAERFQADRVLSEAMNIACYVAPIMIQLKSLLDDTDEFQRIINKISQLKCISIMIHLSVYMYLIRFCYLLQ